jgi:glyoxylase-like metal-dependent hydrolase (beta-lactamase superfamily II)
MRALRILGIVLLVLVVLGFAAWRYLLGRTAVPETTSYVLELTELRRLASAQPGPFPVAVNQAQVAVGSLPRGAVFAGESIREPLPMTHGAYQVLYADGSFGMIDSAFSEAALHVMNPDATFDAAAYDSIQRGLGQAKWIAITHEHADHIGGVADFDAPDSLVGRLALTSEQLANGAALDMIEFPAELRTRLTPIAYDHYYALAPGVVLVKAPGHTPGSQLVYVALVSGRELLVVGDVAWHMDQIRQLWYRPRLVTDFFIGEDRAAVMGELRKLRDVGATNPTLQIVVSHDVDQRQKLLSEGLIGDKFALP